MRGGGPWAAKLSSARVDLLGVLARLSEVLGGLKWQQNAKGGRAGRGTSDLPAREGRCTALLQKSTYPLPASPDLDISLPAGCTFCWALRHAVSTSSSPPPFGYLTLAWHHRSSGKFWISVAEPSEVGD
ncbi:hypothetical protein BDP55DRAFT_340073 [Colletotrichum godetiae]|uniref:Uncharacterized protein n=1 Tax=Colletotrichum godetiae TaxID=1209918 RepID=A0AAJ0AV26_9PEZI|nr:uncharacterized protein BDP55DRAFT_340073 [Colletotrichum godetiae]KAK1690137.1 hypothetical protein BDP55DRAFT_340073 [Colletotrichum godetiae]